MSSLSNLSVRAKLAWCFGILTVFVGLVAGLGAWRLESERERFAHFVERTDQRLRMAHELLEATQLRAIAARNLLIVKDEATIALEKESVRKSHERVQESLIKLQKDLAEDKSDASAAAMVAELARIESQYGPVAQRIVGLLVERQKATAEDQMDRLCRPLLVQLTNTAERFMDHVSKQADVQAAASLDHFARSRNLLLAAGLVAFICAVLMFAFVPRSITRALGAEPSDLAAAANRIAAGDLGDETLPVRRDVKGVIIQPPLGSVMASMQHMVASLRRIVSEVRSGSDSIATASREIAQGNLDLSARTEQQAASLQQTAASMQELGTTVRRNADTARQASQLAATASNTAQTGGEVVTEVVQTMRDIDQSSHKIASIISVIDGIAFQTNILALNAAVEAARAGEQGRGFAVVAGEVRNLAQRSAAAAKEIKGLIEDSVQRVERGAQLADKAGSTMVEIVASIRQVADLMTEISAATADQTEGVTQVGQAVTQMDRVTQQNAALVEEGAAAADSLREQAQRLVSLVAAFRMEHAALQTQRAGAMAAQAIERAAAPALSHEEAAVAGRSSQPAWRQALTPPATGLSARSAPQASEALLPVRTSSAPPRGTAVPAEDENWSTF